MVQQKAPGPGPSITLLGQLVAEAARDVAVFGNAVDPNRRLAGEAALRAVTAVLRCASEVRDTLIGQLSEPARPYSGRHGDGPGGPPLGWANAAGGRF